ncbi:hypothetical protein ACFY2Y_08250 [Janibacter hoylei]|uniref:hypothetical protein n=1 Tax=Janibacter hoylei TaxID=364298 RepID=UPI0036C03C8C
MRMRRTAVVLALAMVVTGCSSKEDATEERIREGLPDDSVVATVMDDQPTESRELDLPQVPDWRLAEVRATGERPFTTVVAYPPEGDPRTLVLTGNPDSWRQITTGGRVEDAAGALAVARAWYDSIRRTDQLWYRVESVDDIDWQPVVDEDEVTRLKEAYRGRITAPEATRSGDGWSVALWTIEQGDLLRHELTIGTDATVDDSAETLEKKVPVSVAV